MHDIVPLEVDWWERNIFTSKFNRSLPTTRRRRVIGSCRWNFLMWWSFLLSDMLVLFDGNRGALLALVPPTFLPKYMNTNNNSTRVVIVWGVTKCLLVHTPHSFPRYLYIFRGSTLGSRPHGTRWSSVILTRRWWVLDIKLFTFDGKW